MRRAHLFLPNTLLARVKALALAREMSMAELIRRAIDEYLQRNEG
jgi:Ribbon-helix-helix protein, copG family